MIPCAQQASELKHGAYPRSILFADLSESSAARLIRWRSPPSASLLRRPVRVEPCAGQTASGGSSSPALGGLCYRSLATEGSFMKGNSTRALSDLRPFCSVPSE